MGDRAVRWMPGLLLTGLFAWVVARSVRPLDDPDVWWHLRLGNDLIAEHSLRTPEHWSAYATVPWVPTEAVPEVVAAYVQRVAGLAGLAVLFAAAALTVVAAVFVTNRREAAPLAAAIATVAGALAASASLSSRPQLVSFVLLPITLAAWLQTERDGLPRWWLVPLVWAWSLCHGFWFLGAAYGFLFVAGFALSRRFDVQRLLRLAALAVASVAVVALNPIGPGVLEAPLAVHSTSRFIQEWQRTDLSAPSALGGLAMIVVTAVIWAGTRRGVTLARALLLASAVFWLWYAGRTVAVAGLVTAPLLAAALQTLVDLGGETRHEPLGVSRRQARLLVAGLVAAVAVAVLVAPSVAARPGGVPTALDPALDALPPGTRVFNAYELGGWIAWRHPDLEQYIDGLITPYSEQHAADYERAVSGLSGWYGVVRASGAPVALVPTDGPLAAGLRARGWRTVGTSAGYSLLRRPGAPSS